MTDLAQREPQQIQSLRPKSYGQIIKLANMACESGMVPKPFANEPHKTAVAMMMLAENDLPVITGLKYVAVINGQPAFYSDAVPGIARKRGLIKRRREWFEGTGDNLTAHCEVINSDGDTFHSSFSVSNARRAKLWDKDTYKQYPERMLMWRARSYAIRDAAPDAFMGPTVEELEALAAAFVGPDHAKELNPQGHGEATEPVPQRSKLSVIADLNQPPRETIPETAPGRAMPFTVPPQDVGYSAAPAMSPQSAWQALAEELGAAPISSSQEPSPPTENASTGQQSASGVEAVIGGEVYHDPIHAAQALIVLIRQLHRAQHDPR